MIIWDTMFNIKQKSSNGLGEKLCNNNYSGEANIDCVNNNWVVSGCSENRCNLEQLEGNNLCINDGCYSITNTYESNEYKTVYELGNVCSDGYVGIPSVYCNSNNDNLHLADV